MYIDARFLSNDQIINSRPLNQVGNQVSSLKTVSNHIVTVPLCIIAVAGRRPVSAYFPHSLQTASQPARAGAYGIGSRRDSIVCCCQTTWSNHPMMLAKQRSFPSRPSRAKVAHYCHACRRHAAGLLARLRHRNGGGKAAAARRRQRRLASHAVHPMYSCRQRSERGLRPQ